VDVGDDHATALGGQAHDRGHEVAVADTHRADDLVAHAAPGLLLDQLEGLLDAARGVGGAELLGGLPLELHRVDGEDPLGAGEAGALHGGGAEATDADDGDVVAGVDLGGVDGRAPTGGGTAAQQHDLVEREVGEDLHDRPLVHHAVGGEGAEAGHDQRVLSLHVHARAAVEHVPAHHLRPVVAQVRMAVGARRALPADGDERVDDVVARLQALHVGAHGLDDAGALVPGDPRVAAMGHVPGDEVLVGVAQARGHVAHEHLGAPGLVELDVLHRPGLVVRPPQHCGSALHGSPSCRPALPA
jgi:hypothetical protein